MSEIDLRPYVCTVTDFGVINHFEPGVFWPTLPLEGQGFFVSPRHVLTASHCVHDLLRWKATNHAGVSAGVSGFNVLSDKEEDVALLTLRKSIGPASLFTTLAATQSTLSPSDAFYGVAFFNDERGLQRFDVTTEDSDVIFGFRSSTPIKAGYSGAAILDQSGAVVGVVSGIPRQETTSHAFRSASKATIDNFLIRAGLLARPKREKPSLLERLSRLILR